MPANPDATLVRKLKEVGRYALGVEWGDGHDSILPYKTIRHVCLEKRILAKNELDDLLDSRKQTGK